ncbi:MAG: hypothetical protein DME75_05140, partial [Verrucomicrobia bacterium]
MKTGEINHEEHKGHKEFAVAVAVCATLRHPVASRSEAATGAVPRPFRDAAKVCRLDHYATFCLYRRVPAVDDGSSRGAIGQSTQDGAVAFATTHWSVVLAARGESTEARAALEKLCRIYWWPLYGFVRREGYKPEEAQDMTQAFFARLLERRDLETVRQERGRLRS